MRPIALHGHTRAVTRVKYNRDGDLFFSTSKDGFPCVWDSETGERLGSYDGHKGAVWDIDINYTSTLIATAGADSSSRLWDLRTGECVLKLEAKTPVRTVCFSHGDEMLLAVTDSSFGNTPALNVYGLPMGGTPESILQGSSTMSYDSPFICYERDEKITCAAWGPTNDTIYFSSDDGSISVFDVQKNVEDFYKMPHQKQINRFCFDKDYVTLITASSDQSSKLLDVKTLDTLKAYESDKPVNDAAISPIKDQIILAGGHDAQSVTNLGGQANKIETHFFHKILQEQLGSIHGHFGPVNALTFSPSGRSFVTGGEDGFIRLHHFDSDYFESED